MSSGRLFCLNLCQICFISSPEVSVWETLLFFSFMLFNFFPREKSLTLRELAFPLFLRWKIFDHFQLLYTIGEMENSIAEEFSRHLWGITKLWPCLPASYYFRKPIMVRATGLLFYFRQQQQGKDWNKCLVFFGCKIQKRRTKFGKAQKKIQGKF